MPAEVLKEEKSINPWLACLPTMASAFMFVLDETIANVALPHMAGSFSVSREESMWILTSYLIASGIVIPMVGWFSKVMGRKNFFMFSIILFTLASALCGFAPNMETMVFARILQGFGGGGLLPVSQAILLENFKPQERGKAMAVFCMKALKEEGINKVSLIAFQTNEGGNKFWQKVGWTFREDLNYYDFTLNEENITNFIHLS